MSTTEQRKRKRETKREERRAIKLHSEISVGHSMPVPTPPDFGPSKFTKEDQAANPNMPMTRVIKDVLRLGRWKEGFDESGQPVFGDYTPQELQTILNNARLMMASGHAINYGKSHGDEQLIIPTDELISPIDDIRLDNGVIWTATYVTPEQAIYLSNPARKVSAGLYRNYVAGNGTRYNGRTMLHVAVTDRPVVDRQGPFIIALSNYVALGTWDEAKHKRNGGKFASKGAGGGKPAPKSKAAKAKKTAAIAGAGLVAGAKIGAAEKAVGTGAKYAGKGLIKAGAKIATPIAKKAGKVIGAGAKRAGKAGANLARAGGRAAARAGIKVVGAGSRAAGNLAVGIARRGLRKGKKLAKRVAKVGVKGLVSAGRAGVKAAKSKTVRQGLKAGGRRGLQIAGRIARTVAKSPARKFVLKFNNTILSAIALANTLGGSSMDPTILAGINALLAKMGLDPIPDGTPPEQIGPILTGIAIGLGMQPDDDEETEEEDPNAPAIPGVTAPTPGVDPTVAMNNLLTAVDKRIEASNKPLFDAITSLTAAVAGKQAVEVDDKKAKWILFRNALGKAGVPEATLAAKDKLGEKCDWDTEILEGIKPTVKMSNLVSAGGATEAIPDVPVPGAPLTDEQVAARIKAKGGKVENIPGQRG